MRPATALPFLAVLGIGVGCKGQWERPPFEIRDSSGVRVVESLRPIWSEGGEWWIGTDPLLRIGVIEGDAGYQFDGVTGAVRLADGAVVVANSGFQDVRFFDANGSLTTIFGGPGEGPSEFQGLSGLGLNPEGLIWAYDFQLRRITWLNSNGELVSSTRLGPEPAVLRPLGPFPDGTFLLAQLWGARQVAGAREMGLRRDPVAYVRFDADGSLVDTLGLFPGREVFITEENGRGVMSTPPFARTSVGGVWGGRLVVGSGEAFSLEGITPGGKVEEIIRLPGLDLTLGPEDREEYVRERLGAVPPERRPGLRSEIEAMPFPDSRPAFGSILPDDAGNLWVGDWAPGPRPPEHWAVFDHAGRWMGSVAFPRNFSPTHIGEEWVLGVEFDEMNVEYVALYPLVKTPSEG